MEKLTLYIDPALHRELKELARVQNRSQAELVREALAVYLQQETCPAPTSIGTGEDGEIPAGEIKNWLRAHWRPR